MNAEKINALAADLAEHFAAFCTLVAELKFLKEGGVDGAIQQETFRMVGVSASVLFSEGGDFLRLLGALDVCLDRVATDYAERRKGKIQ